MMNLRAIERKDVEEIAKYHESFFQEEFEIPDFFNRFHGAYIIEDGHDNDFVLAGGVRPIAELIVVTNKSMPAKKRVIALKEATKVGAFIALREGYDQLHCFVQGDRWSRQVQTFHFRPTKGQALVLDV